MRIFLLPVVLLFTACTIANKTEKIDFKSITFENRPKNIIFLIGDGMALSQMSAHVYWHPKSPSIFESFPFIGFHKSYSFDDLVTDSAAGATAFSCGEKTTNAAIGVLPPDNRPCTTILEDLDKSGWATGMVVTCSAPHATPAAFIAHREMRAQTDEIAYDYLHTDLDCFIGGGEEYFDMRADKINLLDTLKKKGYVIRKNLSYNKLPLDGSAPFMMFTDKREPGTASAGRDYLPKATQVACNYLSKRSPKGFFLMVEGSQIDWACHANDRSWLRAEMQDFDETVRKALEFAANDKNTLVVVTGDHECGGLALTKTDAKMEFKSNFVVRMHTAALVPVYAYGPQAQLFSGIYENTAIYYKFREALNWSK
ncbi:MAG: alkaline phosphatase [Bacteroidetes bacterium]|nr:alkaline phosphatase [Bacteroidota bacterium]